LINFDDHNSGAIYSVDRSKQQTKNTKGLKMKKSLTTGFAIAVTALMLVGSAVDVQSQEKVVSTTAVGGPDGEIFMMFELGAVVRDTDEGIKVNMVLSLDQRSEEYRSVDLLQGDFIKMMNGKSMKSVADLKAAYEAMKTGEEIKLGIKRGQDLRIVAFPRGDTENAPLMMVMTQQGPGDGAEGEAPGAPQVTRMQVGGDQIDMEGVEVLFGLGLLIKEVDGHVTVEQVMPFASEVMADNPPQKGDVIVKIQDQEVGTNGELMEIYEGIEAGKEMTLVTLREGEEIVLKFPKPEGGQPTIIRQEQ
jgi:S1-C subfamily serine protease